MDVCRRAKRKTTAPMSTTATIDSSQTGSRTSATTALFATVAAINAATASTGPSGHRDMRSRRDDGSCGQTSSPGVGRSEPSAHEGDLPEVCALRGEDEGK